METEQKAEEFQNALRSESLPYGVSLSPADLTQLTTYYKLLDEWNTRLHLVAPCPPEDFATRHVLESLFLLNYCPGNTTIIDVGSGGGLPLIPCLIVRPTLRGILIESSNRKSVFLRKALRDTRIEKSATVLSDRFENISEVQGEFVTCRALDRFVHKLDQLTGWAPLRSTLLLYGGNSLSERLKQLKITFESQLLPNSNQRFLFKIQK